MPGATTFADEGGWARGFERLVTLGLQSLVRPLFDVSVFEPLGWRLSAPLMRHVAGVSPSITVLTHYDRDLRFSADLGSHIEAQIFWQGFQAADRGEMRMLARLLRPGHVVMDIGRPILALAGREVADVLRFWNRRRYRVGRIGHGGSMTPVAGEADLGVHQNIVCWPEERDPGVE